MTKITTLHPDPSKKGTKIDREKYDFIKSKIIHALEKHQPQGFMELTKNVGESIDDFDGSVGWYVTTIKLDLEARGEIIVDRDTSPQQISLP